MMPSLQHGLFPGTSRMATLMCGHDWAATPLGPVEEWPQALRAIVRVLLTSRYPMFVWWGRELTYLYNDAYIPVLGAKHPQALGRSGHEVWPEIWNDLAPLVRTVFAEGQATWCDELRLLMERSGFREETFFTFSYSPIPDEDGRVLGLFCACTEETERVRGRRRLATLRDLADGMPGDLGEAASCARAAGVLAGNAADVPFALIYLLDADGRSAVRCAAGGIAEDHPGAASRLALDGPDEQGWPLRAALAADRPLLVDDLVRRFPTLSAGAWPEAPRAALLHVLRRATGVPRALLIAGLSPYLRVDAHYREFLALAAEQIASALGRCEAFAAERQRAAALAEIDRAKTAFFSNISHEFRTPLTLMLGPLAECLSGAPAGEQRERLEMVQRNAMRLLRLVNTLLDFARIEAGRAQASFAPVDLAALTADLASGFRSAVEAAGLRLDIDCPPLPQPVHVDRELWEKIVLNLVSNAFKHTFAGAISVGLRADADAGMARLTVADTGTGIAPEHLPRLFERFYRVQGARARSHEGSGIGLALVQDLVRLHGGRVEVESEPGRGSRFIVSIPFGTAHLPPEQLAAAPAPAPATTADNPFLAEAMRWLPAAGAAAGPAPAGSERILLADDNADMRDYVRRLLCGRWQVEAVADGDAALAAARRQPPDLVLSDVLMPGLDGRALVRALRADARLRTVPVILLSARAGEDAGIAGLEAGADDYLVKPFSAQELLARVAALLETRRIRAQAQRELDASREQLEQAVAAARMLAWTWDQTGNRVTLTANAAEILGLVPGMAVEEAEDGFALIHPDDRAEHRRRVAQAVAQEGGYEAVVRVVRPLDGRVIWLEERACARRGPDGRVRVSGVSIDISERMRSQGELRASEAGRREAERRLALAIDVLGLGTFDCDLASGELLWSASHFALLGYDPATTAASYQAWRARVHPEDIARVEAAMATARDADRVYSAEYRIIRHDDGQTRWLAAYGRFFPDEHTGGTRLIGVMFDITRRKQDEAALAEQADELRRSNAELEHFAAIASHDLQEPLRVISNYADLLMLKYAAVLDRCGTEHLDRIVNAALRMRSLIAALLNYAQVGRQAALVAEIPAQELVAEVLEDLKAEIAAKGAEVAVGALPVLRGDRARLLQLMQNLVANALKFSASERTPRVAISAEDLGDCWRLTVADNGIGIPPANQEAIFRIFHRLHAQDQYPGCGIGLATCKKIVEQHGGRLWVESRPGDGAAFSFTVPK